MSKFKVGDLVTPSKFFGGTKIGKPYEVIRVYSNTFMITNDTGDGWYFPDEYWVHYGQTLAELNVKAGDVVEMLMCECLDWVDSICDIDGNGSICDIDGNGRAVARNGGIFTSKYDELFERTWRIISRASDTPNWLPCPPNYKPNDNHEVTYHMGVPTHYYLKEPVLVDDEWRILIMGRKHIAKGKTKDGKPVGQWTIDMDAD